MITTTPFFYLFPQRCCWALPLTTQLPATITTLGSLTVSARAGLELASIED